MPDFFQKIKKATAIIIKLSIVAAVLFGVLCLLAPFLAVIFVDEIIKEEYNNPYIDADYDGWKCVKIDDVESCMFPNSWNISEEQGVIWIEDTDGNLIAVGSVFESSDAAFQSKEAFLTETLGYDVVDIHYEYASNIPLKAGTSGTMTTIGVSENTYAFLSLQIYKQPELFLIFPSERDMNSPELVEFVQAIGFSYAYPESCK